MQTDLTPKLSAHDVIAVIGATDNPSKFGGRIYRNLKQKGYRVVPVNPGRTQVDGDTAYPDLASLPERPTIIDLVVPPSIGVLVARQAQQLGFDNLWFQPGAESPQLKTFLDSSGLDYSFHDCIMVQAPRVRD